MFKADKTQVYDPATSAVFSKTKEQFGGLSNMAAGFPLRVNDARIQTSEALYQACRFPHDQGVQRRIIDERSPMAAKMRSKRFRKQSRPDWEDVRIDIMRWCLRVKLAHSLTKFRELLLETGNLPIVERSRRDSFWGAKVTENGMLAGINVLGQLLMELRDELKHRSHESFVTVDPLSIPDFRLFGKFIGRIDGRDFEHMSEGVDSSLTLLPLSQWRKRIQHDLFEQSHNKTEDGQMSFTKPSLSLHANSDQKRCQGGRDLDCNAPMKRTDIDFAPEIPESWKVVKLKRISHMRSGEGITSGAIEEKGLYPVYGGNGLRGYTDSFTHDGTFALIGRQGALCGNVHLVSGRLWVSEHAIVATLHESHNIEWFVNLLKTMDLNRYSESAAQPGLTSQGIANLCVPLPSLSQQRAIADYLGRETARLDALVAAKQRLLDLLAEKRHALIAHAVTHGIAPRDAACGRGASAEGRDRTAVAGGSGVKPCQSIPPGWIKKRFKYLVRTIKGRIPSSSEGNLPDAKTAPYLSMGYLRGEIEEPEFVTAGRDSLYAENGDVLLLWDGANAGEFLHSKAGIVSSTVAKVIPTEIDDRFLFWMCKGQEELVRSETVGMGIPHVDGDFLANMFIPVPPPPQQRAIADHLDRETARLDALASKARESIALLKERRAALISAAVSGQCSLCE